MTVPGALVRTMLPADLPEVLGISRRSLPQPWGEGVWREELASPYALYLVIAEVGAVSGYIGVRRVADELHVMILAVHPEKRRRGLARVLMDAALADPTSKGARRLYLEVRPSNLAARALYSSMGFVETGTRPRYYGDEDALLMTLHLRGDPPREELPDAPLGASGPPPGGV